MGEDFPKNLLRDIYWAFGGDRFESQTEFNRAIRQYQIDIKKKDDWRPEEIVLRAAGIALIYEFWEGDDEVTKAVEVRADNDEFFTAGELLFKIHNLVTENLKGMDRHFFEGLSLQKPGRYRLSLGS
jgi:hypothetical protein